MVMALRRQKLLLSLGALVALVIGALSMYGLDGKPRAKTEFLSKSRVLVDSKGFGLGRVELASSDEALAGGGFDNRAQTIAYFIDSSLVQRFVPERLREGTDTITAVPFEKVPVFEIQVTSKDPKIAQDMAQSTAQALDTFFRQRQDDAKTPSLQRVTVDIIQPALPAQAQPSKARALGVLAIVVLLGLAVFSALTRDKYQQARANRAARAEPTPADVSADA